MVRLRHTRPGREVSMGDSSLHGRLLKEKRAFFRNALPQTELLGRFGGRASLGVAPRAHPRLRRWIKAKIRVSVQDAQAVLVEPHWEQSRCAILGYCEQVHAPLAAAYGHQGGCRESSQVADPDHDSWEEVPGQEERCSAPWHAGARDAQLQMAKDVLISGVRAFFLGPEKMDQAQVGHRTLGSKRSGGAGGVAGRGEPSLSMVKL